MICAQQMLTVLMMPSAQHHWEKGVSGPTEPISRLGDTPGNSSWLTQQASLA